MLCARSGGLKRRSNVGGCRPDRGFRIRKLVNVVLNFSINEYATYGDLIVTTASSVVKQSAALSFVEAGSIWMMFVTASDGNSQARSTDWHAGQEGDILRCRSAETRRDAGGDRRRDYVPRLEQVVASHWLSNQGQTVAKPKAKPISPITYTAWGGSVMHRSVVISLDLPDAAYSFRITLPYATIFVSPEFLGETPK